MAFALAGTVAVDLTVDPVGYNRYGDPVYLKEIWPADDEIAHVVQTSLSSELFNEEYSQISRSNDMWNRVEVTRGQHYNW